MLPSAFSLFAFLFEAPLSAAAVAGGVVAVPIVIHLLNRKRFRIVTWAAMRFLLAAQRKNSRRMRLEQLILLAVRCLIVLLLVLAMASVTGWAEGAWHWFFPEGAAGTASSGLRAHKIIVIDGSFSMGLKVGDTTCFERARALASQIVRDGPGGDGYSVVLMAAPPRRVVPEPSEDARKVAAEIDALRLPHGNADLAATLNTVESLLRSSPGKFLDREVYFLTDMQQSTWIVRQPAAIAGTLQKIQSRARAIFVDVGQEGANNLAVTGLELNEGVATVGQTITLVATVHNFGSETRNGVHVKLLVGRARDKGNDAAFKLDPGNLVKEETVSAPRGHQTTIPFTFKFTAPGDYVVQVQLEGDNLDDNLDLDNVRSAVLTVKKDVPVMLVNGKPAVDPFDQATEWLRLALNPFEGERPPANVIARPAVLSETQFADEGLGDLTPYDCVFLCDVPSFSLAEARRLEGHLRRGGGVIVCLGDKVDVGAYNETLYRSGNGILPARLMSRQTAPEGFSYKLLPDRELLNQDPLRAFVGEEDYASLVAPGFRRFILAEPAPRGGPRKLLSFNPTKDSGKAKGEPVGGPAVLEWQPPLPPLERGSKERSGRTRGRVILVTTAVNSDWSTWPAAPSYPALMQELLQYASAGRLREKAISVGDPIEEFRPTPGGGQEVRIRIPGPEQREESVRTQSFDDGSVLRWTDTDVSGIYRAFIGNDPHEYLYAVNVPTLNDQQASESDLTRTNHEELQKVYPEWETQIVTDLGQVVHGQGTVGGEAVQRPWGPIVAHWLLLALLILLFAEIVLAWQFGHYSSVAADESGPRPLGKAGWALYVLAGLLFVSLLGGGFVLAHDAWTGDFLGFLPDGMRHSVEEWMDVPPPAPGEGSHWRLEYASYLWDGSSDPWLAGAVACAAGALVAWVYRREGRTPGSFRVVMGGLRLGLIAVVLAVLLPQLKFWFERQGWPDVAILIDDSQSMSANDRHRDPRIQAAADRLARLGSITEPDRLRLAQALLTHSDPDWLTDLLTRRHVRVHLYHCSGRAHRLNDLSAPEDVGPALESIRGLSADASNDSSQLGAAVRQVLNDFRGSSLAAVVMLTDGVTTEGEDLVKASKYASQMGVPLFFVGLGDAHEVRDVYLHDLQCEDSVYVNDRIVFDLRLTGQGYTDLTVPVELREKGKDEVLDRQTVKVDPNGKPVKVRLVHKPTTPGEKLYELRVPKQADEVEEENNRIERAVFVRESKLIKVLYVEGYRRYEYHFIKTLLERESDRAKGNKTIDLKVLLVEADPDYAVQDRSAISDFPPKSVLNTYDVVILGDVDPRPRDGNKMDEHVKDLADFVREKGGGLLMIAGERYAPHAYKNTALKDVLPIDVIADHQPDEPPEGRVEGYRPELTPVGRMHPIFRFHPEEKENDEIWGKLREMFWWSEGYQIKRAAEVLAVHPKARATFPADRRPADAGVSPDKHPLVVQQFVGAGRAMFFGFNETWRWGFREDQLRFNQFWIQTIRYLARSRLGRIDLRLDRPTAYRRGEPIKMKVRFPDDAPPPPDDTEVKVVVERRNKGAEADVRTVQLAKVEGTRASYEAVLTRTPEGDYKFWLSQPAAGNPKPRAECKVLAPPGEMEKLRMNQPDMERAADETHGKFYSLADADHLLDELPAGTRVTLNAPAPPKLVWNHALVFLAVLLLLTVEWLLRKQKNLL